MTGPENERLAVVETKVDLLASDVAEVKRDVKSLLTSRSQLAGVGGFVVRAIPFVALGVSVFAMAAK